MDNMITLENPTGNSSGGRAMLDSRPHRHYSIYGMRLCSVLPLPELMPSQFAKRDIEFSVALVEQMTDVSTPDIQQLTKHSTNVGCDLLTFKLNDGYLLRWEGKCDFIILGEGRYVRCDIKNVNYIDWVQSILYGTVLSFILHIQNIGNLHASAVVTNRGAIAFIAEPGTGKSTLATRFLTAGHQFLTDDVLAITEEPFVAHPGFPYTSLSAESIEGILRGIPISKADFSNGGKRRVGVDGSWASFSPEPVPVAALFLLSRAERGAPLKLEKVNRIEATRALLNNSVCLPFLPPEAVRQHLGFASRLSGVVPVWQLSYPSGFDHTDSAVNAVLDVLE